MKKLALIILAIAILIVPMSICASAAELNLDKAALLESLDDLLAGSDTIILSDSDKAAVEALKEKIEADETAELSVPEQVLVEAVNNKDFSTDPSKASVVNEHEQAIIDSLKEKIKVDDVYFEIPENYINMAVSYMKTVDISKRQSVQVLEKVEASKELVQQDHIHNVKELSALPQAEKEKLLKYGQEASEAVNNVLTYDGENVKIVAKDEPTKELFNNEPILKVTGAEADFTAIVLSVAGLVALLAASVVVASKKGLLSK